MKTLSLLTILRTAVLVTVIGGGNAQSQQLPPPATPVPGAKPQAQPQLAPPGVPVPGGVRPGVPTPGALPAPPPTPAVQGSPVPGLGQAGVPRFRPRPAPPAQTTSVPTPAQPAPVPTLTQGDYSYTTDDKGQATIVGFSKDFKGELTIIDTLGGYPVSRIGSYAFASTPGITRLTIPASVTNFGVGAFADCTGLTSVAIPDGVTSIGINAFFVCTGLIKVTIPGSVTNIGAVAFDGCSGLTEINVDDGNAEYSSLRGVLFDKKRTVLIKYPGGKSGSYTIPGSVTNIGEGAFNCCTGLTGITIPGSVTNIGAMAFDGCSGLSEINVDDGNAEYSSLDGVMFDKNWTTLILYPRGKPGSYTIPDSVTSLGRGAFSGCTSLASSIGTRP